MKALSRPGISFVLATVGGLLFFGTLYAPSPLLYDTDAEFHLSVARTYAEEGVGNGLDDLRFSLLAQGGDKELLFHLLLVPFAGQPSDADPFAAARWVLALLGATILGLVAFLAVRAAGPWAVLTPFFLLMAAPEWTWRLVRLRPELLALIWILLALAVLGTRFSPRTRGLALAILAFLFTLSYTAFHAFVGLAGLWFLAGALRAGPREWRRWPWELLLGPALGAGLGLVAHPQFPANLDFWAVQNLRFFLEKGNLAVGTEIRPNTTEVLLLALAGWWLALAAVWRARRPGGGERSDPEARRRAQLVADAGSLAAVVFGGLYLLMSRFVLYAVPLVSLALLWEIRRRGEDVGSRTRLPLGLGRPPLAVALAVCVLIALPSALREWGVFHQRLAAGEARLEDRRALARTLPPGARVAASWQDTAIYRYWAPQGRYLNALDPVFFATPFPEQHEVWRRIAEGRDPDVPGSLLGALESDFLALSRATAAPRLLERLEGDPRVEAVHHGGHAVFRVRSAQPGEFFRRWTVIPPGVPLPPPRIPDGAPPWGSGPGAEAAAYIDLSALAPAPPPAGVEAGCRALAHKLEVELEEPWTLELAAAGPSSLWLDDELLAATGADGGVVLGKGLLVSRRLAPGTHRLTVLTCPPRRGESAGGFYLRRR